MAIEWRGISTLIPYARNARTHSDAQIAEIAGSIREFGFTNPVLIDPEGGIIAGHGRVLAARQLGMEQIPTICLSEEPSLHMTRWWRKPDSNPRSRLRYSPSRDRIRSYP